MGRKAVFGLDENGKINDEYVFDANNLSITNIDIQSVEPIDQRTRDSLQKSVQLAIEITTKSQEATARHDAQRKEQEARGKLERQKINDEFEAEAAVKQAELRAQASKIKSEAELEQAKKRQ